MQQTSEQMVMPEETEHRGRGPLRRLYDWVLSWADSRHGLSALATISFAESSFFPIPPDVLQIALSVARPTRSFLYAAVSTVASVAGALGRGSDSLQWTLVWSLVVPVTLTWAWLRTRGRPAPHRCP